MDLISVIIIPLILINYSHCITFEEDVTLSVNQKVNLDKFKAQMLNKLPHDYMKKDIYLVRWLKARHFNIPEAKIMLMDNLKWREEERMDTIHEEDWSDMARDYRFSVEGRDKQARPILYINVGTHDIRQAVITGKTKRYVRYVNKSFDELCTLVRTLGEKYGNITRGNVIMDLDGFTIQQNSCIQCIPVLINNFLSSENHYPLCVDQTILVNAPSIVEPILNAFLGVAGPDLSRSLRVFGTNRKTFKDALSKDFDFSELPPSIGGTKIYSNLEEDY